MLENEIICGDWIEALKELPDGVFHLFVTSPPYWGQRDYGVEGQLGLEKTPEEHIEKLVEGFREVRRVLRDDGVLFLNYGDKYWGGKGKSSQAWSTEHTDRGVIQKPYHQIAGMGETRPGDGKHEIYDSGDLLMLPARVALALQADGWILRDDIIWAKAVSFCDVYSGSTMPESVNGTRWERHRIKVGTQKGKGKQNTSPGSLTAQSGGIDKPEYIDCPGCEKCEPNGGLVLRRGSWRCTKAHEHIFQFVKSGNYFSDMEAIREEHASDPNNIRPAKGVKNVCDEKTGKMIRFKPENIEFNPAGRNLRNVWAINPRGYSEAHYATYPEAIVEPCIKVATSKKGVCPECGSQWARIVDNKQVKRKRPNDRTDRHNQGNGVNSCGNTVAGVETTTLGWKPTCDCGIEETVPALVGDCFMGSGTTAVVAAKLGRNYWGCEINPEYVKEHCDIRVREVETAVPKEEFFAGQQALFA